MDITRFIESEYVDVKMVSESTNKKAIILTDGVVEDTKFGKRLTLTVSIMAKIKKYTPNKISLENLKLAYGLMTESWVNKIIELRVESDVNNNRLRVVAHEITQPEVTIKQVELENVIENV